LKPVFQAFIIEDRSDAPAVARREWTRQWWDNNRDAYELLSSTAVIEELENGEYAKQSHCLSLLEEIPLLGCGNK